MWFLKAKLVLLEWRVMGEIPQKTQDVNATSMFMYKNNGKAAQWKNARTQKCVLSEQPIKVVHTTCALYSKLSEAII